MKRLLAVFVMMALPAAAQNRPAGSGGGGQASGGGGGSHASAAPSGGGGGTAAPSGGGSGSSGGAVSSGGGSHSGSGSSGGGHVSSGGGHAAKGGSGVPVRPRGQPGGYSAPGIHGGAGAIAGGNSSNASGAGSGDARAAARNDGSPRNARTGDGLAPNGTAFGRPHGNEPIVGTAVPRGSVPPASRPGAGTIVTSGAGYYYPWYWLGGGAALYSNCWMYNPSYCSSGFGYLGGYGGYGASYSGYYDPWFGGYPDMDQAAPAGGGGNETFVPVDEGSLKLKIKPKDAEVYVDGFYVGIVDDFDGMFQKLHIETGPHRVEIRAEGYEPLIIEVRITAEHATTYQGELKRIK